jgi:hypothetical protein
MVRATVQAMIQRELAGVRRTVEAYPDDASVWATMPGLPNAGGTLVLHIAGNLQHYFGAVLAQTGYRRDRGAEFSRRDVPRRLLLAELDAAAQAVTRGLDAISDETLLAAYPEAVAGRTVQTGVYLLHLATHLAYHFGQLDYHRRGVTGDSRSMGAIAPGDLPAWNVEAQVDSR